MHYSAQYLNEMVEQFTLDTRAVSVANDLAIIAAKRKDNKARENTALIPSVTQTESQTKPRQIAALPAPNASKKEKTEEWEEF
jgi:hypothetical protein